MKFRWSMGIAALLPVLLLTGCGEKGAEEPPLQESELLTRFFKATQEKRYEEAVRQLDKLQLLNPENGDLGEMRIRLVCNACVIKVQPLVDQGKFPEALALIRAARQENPMNYQLALLEKKVTDLQKLEQALQALRAASDFGTLSVALDRIQPLLVPGSKAEELLKPEITKREQDLQRLKKETEKKNASAMQSQATAPETGSAAAPAH